MGNYFGSSTCLLGFKKKPVCQSSQSQSVTLQNGKTYVKTQNIHHNLHNYKPDIVTTSTQVIAKDLGIEPRNAHSGSVISNSNGRPRSSHSRQALYRTRRENSFQQDDECVHEKTGIRERHKVTVKKQDGKIHKESREYLDGVKQKQSEKLPKNEKDVIPGDFWDPVVYPTATFSGDMAE